MTVWQKGVVLGVMAGYLWCCFQDADETTRIPAQGDLLLSLGREVTEQKISAGRESLARWRWPQTTRACYQAARGDLDLAHACLIPPPERGPWLEKAASAYRKALALHPWSGLWHFRLGYARWLQGRQTESDREMEGSEEAASGMFHLSFRLGEYWVKRWREGGGERALAASLRTLRRASGDFYDFIRPATQVFRSAGPPEDFEPFLFPPTPMGIQAQFSFWSQRGNPRGAWAAFSRVAVPVAPEARRSYQVERVGLLWEAGMTDRARNFLEAFLGEFPGEEAMKEIFSRLGSLPADGQLDALLARYESSFPGSPVFDFCLGMRYWQARRWSEARERLERYRALRGWQEVREPLIDTYLHLEDENGLHELRNLAKVLPLSDQEQLEQEISSCRELLRKSPTPEVPAAIREEVARVEEKSRASPYPHIYYDRLARLYAFRLGDWNTAYRYWASLRQLFPKKSEVGASLARAAFVLGKKEEALLLLDEVIMNEVDPGRRRAYQAQGRGWTSSEVPAGSSGD